MNNSQKFDELNLQKTVNVGLEYLTYKGKKYS